MQILLSSQTSTRIHSVTSQKILFVIATSVRTPQKGKKKGKIIPVTGLGGPWGGERSRLPHFLDNWLTDGGKVVSLMRRPPFIPQEDS
jgi:hypothetical protein